MKSGLCRASARAGGLLVVELTLLLGLGLGLSGSVGTPWDLLFVLVLSLALAPLAFLDELAPRRGPAGEGALALTIAAWASLGLLFAFAQTTYLAHAWSNLDIPRALDRSGDRIQHFFSMAAETRVLLAALAPPFALAFVLRRGGARPWQTGLGSLLGTLILARLAKVGFEGLPQVRWLVGSRWASPWLGTWVLVQPWLLALILPGLAALARRRWPEEAQPLRE